ncbi:hypothetical protein [Microvirga sp. VF16]|uniref:hypothetical protein n=1 Tax=Microvirga sp. VF16 TaxID=2807101 RepID=UPI00193E5ADE|nr:hypothetical protein [Microvirga sp. VF16]QRM29365.1 hypothetical protein JO965_24910 [Microvirga sp. VF16]
MIGHTKSGLKSLTAELLTTTLIGIALLGPAVAQSPATGSTPARESSLGKAEGADNLLTLLPLLLTSPDRRRLAADLEVSIRTGNLKKAEESLNSAIEVGTLAIVLVDHLNNPDLITTLQGLGIRNDPHPTPESTIVNKAAAEVCTAPPAAAAANLADMQQALEQERSFSAMVSQTLTGLMQEHNELAAQLKTETEAKAATASEMQQALQREQNQGAAARRELEKLQEEHRALQATREQDKVSVASNASELEALLRQERERSDNAAHQLASAEKELLSLQAFKDEAMASESAKILELKKALVQAQTRSDMLTEELVDTTEELHALQESHRPSATPVMFRLAATGSEPPLAPPQQEAPPQVLSPPAAVGVTASLVDTARALINGTSALPSKEPTSVVVASLPEGIQPLPLGTATAAPVKTEAPSGTEPKVSAPVEAPKADERLTMRAEELLRKGDVSGARLLLERALDSGNARAAFLLAETFDPNVLSRLGVLGIRGEPSRARELYARARAMGIAQAGERMEALK